MSDKIKQIKLRKVALFLPFLIFALLAGIFYAQVGQNNQYLPSVLVGSPMLDFSLPELETNELIGKQDLGSGAYLINFWGTWCPACSYEHEYLIALAEQGVKIIGINYKDDTVAAKKWLQEKGNPYTHVLVDASGNFGIDMGITGAPETFIINTEGKVTYRHQGIVNEQVWQQMQEFM